MIGKYFHILQRPQRNQLNLFTNKTICLFFAGSVLDNGHSYTSGRHASLMAPSSSRGTIQEATQLREGLLTGTLTGQKINYLDSGYSEEDADQQVTSCLMKTSSGSIYIPPSKKNIHMSTFYWFKRLFYFFLLYMLLLHILRIQSVDKGLRTVLIILHKPPFLKVL